MLKEKNERLKNKMNPKDYFDNAADTWDDKFQTPRLLSFLERLVPQCNLKFGQKVLDVGTGTGVLVPYLIKAVGPSGAVTAIDFSEKMVQKCKTKYSHTENVTVRVGNIEDVAFPSEAYDAVICFGMFPHIEKKEKAVQNINRMLKPDGKLVIAHALSSKELKAHHKKVSEHVEHAILPEKNEMLQLLKQTGFLGIRITDELGCYLCVAHKPSRP
jgi:ubiquinone/menaquinone biosynthesis C-methylase UbiE